MGIVKIFDTTWEQAVIRAAAHHDIEVIADQRIVIDPVHIGNVLVGECVVMYGKSRTPDMVAVRYTHPALAVSAFLHLKMMDKRVKGTDITGNITYEKGLVSCVYTRSAWLQSLQRQHSVSQSEQSPPKTSEDSTVSQSPQTSPQSMSGSGTSVSKSETESVSPSTTA